MRFCVKKCVPDSTFPCKLERTIMRSSSSSQPRKSSISTKIAAALAETQQIYRELEHRPAQRDCRGRAECCQFGLTGKTPYLTKSEALLAAKGWRASGRRDLPAPADGSCPFMRHGRCQIYEHRPFACRTHFCEAAGGLLPRTTVRDLIQRLEELDTELGGEGATQLPHALRQALKDLR